MPLYFVSELARQHVKVVLTGEGSDELLAGYGKYLRTVVNWRAGGAYELVPRQVRHWVAARVVPGLPGTLGRYTRRSFLAMPRTPEAMVFDNFAGICLSRQRSLLSDAYARRATADIAYGASRVYFDAPNRSSTLLDRLLYTDIKTYLVELLMKQDQMSMAASIESRVPFLDHHLVEFVARLQPRLKLRRLTTKWLLRQTVQGLLPRSILTRPKMGFPVPFSRWVRGPRAATVSDVLLDRRTRQRGIINPAAVEDLLRAHRQGRVEGGDAIWALLNLELWYRTFIDGEGVQTLSAGARQEPAIAAPLRATA